MNTRPDRCKKSGFAVTAELCLLTTILVIGLLVGMAELRDSLVAESDDLAEAFGAINQGYSYQGNMIMAVGGVGPFPGSICPTCPNILDGFKFAHGGVFEDDVDLAHGDLSDILTSVIPVAEGPIRN